MNSRVWDRLYTIILEQRARAAEIPVPIPRPERESSFRDFIKHKRVRGSMKIGIIIPMIIYCRNRVVLSILILSI